MFEGLSACVLSRWQLGINDPYVLSWVMVAIYSLAALLALAVARRAAFPAKTCRRERGFWIVVGGVLVIMAVNKQADLQTLMIATGACLLQSQGWSDQSDVLKSITLAGLAVSALASGAVFLWALLPTFRRTALPLLGLALMLGFIMFRAAASFGTLGALNADRLGYWPDRILELAGPAVIVIAAVTLLGQRRPNVRSGGDRIPRP